MAIEIKFTDKKTLSTLFAKKLQDKWNEENRVEGQRRASDIASPHYSHSGGATTQFEVTIEEGNRFDRIVTRNKVVFVGASGVILNDAKGLGYASCHAFIERATGRLIKSATWASPAKWGKDLASKFDLSTPEGFALAMEKADASGGYLYK